MSTVVPAIDKEEVIELIKTHNKTFSMDIVMNSRANAHLKIDYE